MKEKCIDLFNNIVQQKPLDFDNFILVFSEYLTDINYEKSEKLINLITRNPQSLSVLMNTFGVFEKLKDHFCIKYNINWISIPNINQTIIINGIEQTKIIYFYGT